VFIPSIRINTQRNSKPAFQRSFSVQKLSKAISKETAPITPQHKLAKLFKKQQEGPLEVLKKVFNPEELDGFFTIGYIEKIGQNWKKTEMGDKFILQFYRTPTPIEKRLGRRLAAKQRELGIRN